MPLCDELTGLERYVRTMATACPGPGKPCKDQERSFPGFISSLTSSVCTIDNEKRPVVTTQWKSSKPRPYTVNLLPWHCYEWRSTVIANLCHPWNPIPLYDLAKPQVSVRSALLPIGPTTSHILHRGEKAWHYNKVPFTDRLQYHIKRKQTA